MKEIMKVVKNKELIVKKRVRTLIEKILRFYGYDFSHDRYKLIINDEVKFECELEEKYKKYYDGYMFLLNNKKTVVTYDFLSRFYYLVKNEELDKEKGMKIASKYFYLNCYDSYLKSVYFHLYVYEILKELEEYERTLISLMFFNYSLVKEGIPICHMVIRDITRYIKYRDLYYIGKDDITKYLKDLILNNKYQDKKYKENLKEISVYDIEKFILSSRELFQKEFNVESVMLFGSFNKSDYKIDSDIDLLVVMEECLPLKMKREKIDKMNKYIEQKMNRYVDIHEVYRYLTDSFLKEMEKVKIIY